MSSLALASPDSLTSSLALCPGRSGDTAPLHRRHSRLHGTKRDTGTRAQHHTDASPAHRGAHSLIPSSSLARSLTHSLILTHTPQVLDTWQWTRGEHRWHPGVRCGDRRCHKRVIDCTRAPPDIYTGEWPETRTIASILLTSNPVRRPLHLLGVLRSVARRCGAICASIGSLRYAFTFLSPASSVAGPLGAAIGDKLGAAGTFLTS